ncbi:hypothetical protein BH10PSE19_BH10PSE19_06910 [soil metagenome]
MHTVTAQFSDEMLDELNTLAETEGRSKSWLIREAVADYIVKQHDYQRMTLEGLKAAREGKLIPHSDIVKELQQWGNE